MVFPLSGPPDTLASTLPSGVSVLRSAATHSEGLSTSFKPSQQGRSGKTGTPAESIVAFAVLEHGESKDTVRESATVGVPTAVVRSMLLQGLQFWYRVPIKLFRPMRVDYLVMARAATLGLIPTPSDRLAFAQPVNNSKRAQFFRATSIGMVAHAVRTQGAGFVYRQVFPPLLMNSFIGSVLYTTYILTLPAFHPAFTYQKSRTFPPPPFTAVFMAGALAGAAQSLVAAPMDSLKIKFQVQDMAHGGKHKSMWEFATSTLRELGLKTVYRGFALTLVKDSLACGLFFGVFEWVKQQGYYSAMDELLHNNLDTLEQDDKNEKTLDSLLPSAPLSPIADATSHPSFSPRPYMWLEPTFVLLAGAAAAIAYQAIDYPLEQVKNIFYAKETELQVEKDRHPSRPHSQRFNASSMRSGTSISTQIYKMTWDECRAQASLSGGWRRFLFSNFASTAMRAVPAASVGFLVFEVMKRKLDARMYESEDREMASFLDRMAIKRKAERLADAKAVLAKGRLESKPEYENRNLDFEQELEYN